MKDLWKHIGLFASGVACIVVGVFFPPAAPVVGVVGAKLLLTGGAALGLGAFDPGVIKAAVQAIAKKP